MVTQELHQPHEHAGVEPLEMDFVHSESHEEDASPACGETSDGRLCY